MRCPRLHSTLMGAVLALWAFGAVGCGSADDAPDQSTITINPETVDWTIPMGGLPGESTIQVFTITLLNSDAQPLNNIRLRLTLSLAPTVATPAITATAFLDNACTDPATCIAAGQVLATPEITRTTDENGVVLVKVLVTFDGEFKDKLEVRSGTAFVSAGINVTEM